ncbi:MAG: mercury(II) reductase [Myxococcota bacterium]
MSDEPRSTGERACCEPRPRCGEAFDLAILGGGSAAFAAARRASELGARVLLVNEGPIGGTCVNVGCVPSKTLIRAAENHHQHGLSRFRGLAAEPGRVDFAELIREKTELVAELRQAKYVDALDALPGVELVPGRGSLRSRHEIAVGDAVFRAEKILIATGARPSHPPIPGLADAGVWDSTSAMEATKLPRELVVLGGRYVALELGQMFARLGSRVTVVQRSEQILPGEDPDLASSLTDCLAREGLAILTGQQVARVARDASGFELEVRRAGSAEKLRADAVLAALGRAPNTAGIGLEALGVERAPNGTVVVKDDLETNVPGIYAAGDVIGEPAYVYAAAYEGGLAAENALTGAATPRDYTAIPWVVFTDPQVAGVGWNEREAAAAGIAVDVSRLPLAQVPRALAARDTRGFVKLLRARGEDRLVGARILAPEGGEQIIEASLMIKFGLPVSAVMRHFHPYLTQSEAVKLAALGFDRDVAKLSCCAQ